MPSARGERSCPPRPKFQGAETVPLVGGLLCLDFVNTTGARASGAARERLRRFEDLLVWCARAGVLTEEERAALGRAARKESARAAAALSRALALREATYRMFLAAVAGESPRAEDASLLQRHTADAASFRRLAWTGGRWTWQWRHEGDLASLMAPIALSAVDLLTGGPLSRVRKCGDCDWLFVDGTKNESRIWCKTACRDRVKARRYYRRRTLGAEVDAKHRSRSARTGAPSDGETRANTG